MLKHLVGLLAVLVAAVLADVRPTVPPVAIVNSGQEKHEDGSYHFFYQGEDGTQREETAVVLNAGTEDEFLEVSGSYSYLDADGKEVVVHYKADDHGFVPEGGSILPQISLAAKQASAAQSQSQSQSHPLPNTDYKRPPKYE